MKPYLISVSETPAGSPKRRASDWPIAGAIAASVAAVALVAFGAWLNRPPPAPAPKVWVEPRPAPPAIAFDQGRAFVEFRARSLGLPTVWTYPVPGKSR